MAGENGATQRSIDSDDIEKATREVDERESELKDERESQLKDERESKLKDERESKLKKKYVLGPAATRSCNEVFSSFVSKKKKKKKKVYDAYKECKNLLYIERDPMYKVALEEFDRKAKDAIKQRDRLEKAKIDLLNQVYQLVGFFSVFQGVVLSAVTTLKSDTFATCGLLWCPLVLSGAATLITVVGVSQKFYKLAGLEQLILDTISAQTEFYKRGDKLRAQGIKRFSFYNYKKKPRRPTPFHWIGFFVVLALLVFAALLILSYFAILCNKFVIYTWNGGLNRP